MGIYDEEIWEICFKETCKSTILYFFSVDQRTIEFENIEEYSIFILLKWRKSTSSYSLSAKLYKYDHFFSTGSLHTHPQTECMKTKWKLREIDDSPFSMLVCTCLQSRGEMNSYTSPLKSKELINVFSSWYIQNIFWIYFFDQRSKII